MAVGKVQPNLWMQAQYYLFEYTPQGLVRYQDYTDPVKLPRYLADPDPGYVMGLSAGTAVKVIQELLRHSTARMTRDTYTQALSPHERAAQGKVVSMIRPKGTCTVVIPRASQEIRATD